MCPGRLGGTMSTLLGPRIYRNESACGCTLTRASFSPLTLDLIEAMDNTEYAQMMMRVMESRAVGVPANTLYDLLLSRIDYVGKSQLHQVKVGGPTSIIAPFKFRERERNWTTSVFRVKAGAVHPSAGAGGIHPGAWRLTVDVGSSPWASPLKHLARYFQAGSWINVEWQTGATVALDVAMKVISASDNSADEAYVFVEPPFTSAGWTALSEANKNKYRPYFGIIHRLTNNLNPYESGGYNEPTNLNRERVVDWFQHSRYYRCTEKEYEEALQAVMTGKINSFARDFKYLNVVERNKQMRLEYDKAFMNTCWFGQRINEFQVDDLASEAFTSLPAVVDPIDTDCVLDRKAHAIGIHTQLVEKSRRIDFQGGALNLDLLLPALYTLKRNREIDGKSHDTIDLMGPRYTKDGFDQVMIRYLKERYGYNLDKMIEEGKTVDEATKGVAWRYTAYDLPKEGLRIAFFTHPFFDDRVSAFSDAGDGGANLSARGRWLVALDWDDIKIGVAEHMTVHREYKNDITAQANLTLAQTMKLNTRYFDMEDTYFDIELGDHARHLLVANFNDACPSLSQGGVCSPAS